MATTSSVKVTPINDAMEELNVNEIGEGGEILGLADLSLPAPPAEDEEINKAKQMKFLRKQVAINRQMERLQKIFTYQYFKSTTQWFLDTAACKFSLSFEDLTLAMTLFVLFGDDIKMLSTPRSDDHSFAVAYSVCLFTFIFELVGSTWAKTTFTEFSPIPRWTGYFLSFFWWLDLIAILSLFPDIPLVGDPVGVSGLSDTVSGGNNYERAGRVMRLVRLVRLVRVYKVASERRARQQQEEELMELVRVGAIPKEDVDKQRGLYDKRQSRLGDQLSESTTRRVIIMILVILVILPLLLFNKENEGPQFAMRMLHTFNTNTEVSQAAKENVLNTFVDSLIDNYNDRYVAYLSVSPLVPVAENPYVYYASYLDNLRKKARLEEDLISVQGGTTYTTSAVFGLTALMREQAMMSILLTICIAIIMIGGALVFTNDAEQLVIAPIERMINMVEAVARDPLAPLQFDHTGSNSAGDYETKLLESTIEKITGLLRVGFGEAGAGIISANLSSKDSGTAINPLLPGVRVYAIFGFCDIHHFEDINRLLEKDVLMFVNHIAEIVHSSVHAWSGQCNKNLGNAFVIVWRIGDEHTLATAQGNTRLRGGSGGGAGAGGSTEFVGASASSGSIKKSSSAGSDQTDEAAQTNKRRQGLIDLRRVPGVDILADQALIGYCKIIAEINRNKYVMRYRTEPRLTDKGKHDFKVRMGFGLHAGWAIEGAVGSLQKVDATYLSPHVNMAARLETSSKQYGVPLLASQDFFDLLSNEGQRVMRRLDVVTVKGSEVPIGIYTYDAFQEQEFREDNKRQRPSLNSFVQTDTALAAVSTRLTMPPQAPSMNKLGGSPAGSGTSTPARRPSITLLLPGTERPAVFLCPEDHTGDVFEQDYDMLTLRKHATDPEFLTIFREGVSLYLAGDWKGAKVQLERADLFMKEAVPALGGDGPSQTLLNYMGNQNYEAPASWAGFRPLTAK